MVGWCRVHMDFGQKILLLLFLHSILQKGKSRCEETINVTSDLEIKFVGGGVQTCLRCIFGGTVDPSTMWTLEGAQISHYDGEVNNGILTIYNPSTIVPYTGGSIENQKELMCDADGISRQYTTCLKLRSNIVPPDEPSNVTVISQTTSSLGLTWKNEFNGLSPITGVEIEYTAVESHGRSQINISRFGNVSLESTILTNLLAYTNYSICVFVVNAIGRSKPGSIFGATLSLFLEAPTITRLEALNSVLIILEWKPPPVNITTTDGVHSWEIEYKMVGSVANRTVVPVNDPTTTTHTLNVNNGTRYLVRVAGLNVRGRGAWSQYMILPQLQSPGERAPRAPAVDCGTLPNPVNGQVSTTGTTSGHTATYSCSIGYDLVGGSTRTCQDTGQWSGSVPTCHPVNCDVLTDPANGQVSHNTGTTLHQTATYSCNTGYDLVGDRTRTCQATGQWSGSAPTCHSVHCDVLTDPANGQVSHNTGTTLHQTATYSCNTGYDLVGDRTRTCQDTGRWSGSAPTCHSVSCGTLTIANGHVSTTGTTSGHTATYSCNIGYDLVGGSTRTCQDTGQWSGSAPTCHPVNCGHLTDPANGRISHNTGTTLQQTATYSCNTGYDLVGDRTRTCQDTGLWSGSEPTCHLTADGNGAEGQITFVNTGVPIIATLLTASAVIIGAVIGLLSCKGGCEMCSRHGNESSSPERSKRVKVEMTVSRSPKLATL